MLLVYNTTVDVNPVYKANISPNTIVWLTLTLLKSIWCLPLNYKMYVDL